MANQIVQGNSVDALPALIDRASAALNSARTSAEVLEARDMARIAYDAAQSVNRIARAKDAHDEVIGAVYRAQADAALIEARAKMRLADEYDAAQDRGEVAGHGGGEISRLQTATLKLPQPTWAFDAMKSMKRESCAMQKPPIPARLSASCPTCWPEAKSRPRPS